jgi:hypothetical protein
MSEFQSFYSGRLWSLLSWEQLTAFWGRIDPTAGWYLYAVGEPVPATPASGEQVSAFITQIDALLHKEHHHDYCGIVYANQLDAPSFIKIFDPNNLGVSCGFSDNPPLPGWILSRVPPEELQPASPLPEGRKRWWRGLFG